MFTSVYSDFKLLFFYFHIKHSKYILITLTALRDSGDTELQPMGPGTGTPALRTWRIYRDYSDDGGRWEAARSFLFSLGIKTRT